jgi:hypothetical protein
MVDYTDYDIDYYSSMEGMGDNFDYMSKVDKKYYSDDSFDYDMVAHNIDYTHAQRQQDLPRQPSRRRPQYTSSFTNLWLTNTFTDTTVQQALRQREHQEQLRRQRIRERKRAEARERLKQVHHEEPKPLDTWCTSAHRTRLSL